MKKELNDEMKFNRKVMYQIYRVAELKGRRAGYSSAHNNEWIKNKGIEPYQKYKVDDTHEFMAHPRKNGVFVSIYYRNAQIDTNNYMRRNKQEMLNA